MIKPNPQKLIVIMVGLPARGKTFLSMRLERYLSWQGYKVKIFNAGSYRRDILGARTSFSSFFNPEKKEFVRERENIAKECFNDLITWMDKRGDIGIYDATNVTSYRREYLISECDKNNLNYIFIENICDNAEILNNIIDIKIENSPDYKGKDREWSKKDFKERLDYYHQIYNQINEDTLFVKIVNFGEKVVRSVKLDKCTDSLLLDVADFIGGVRLAKKDIYLVRHGETFFNTEDRIGGDSLLTKDGMNMAKNLEEFFHGKDMVIFTSEKMRTIQTANIFNQQKFSFKELNEISSGVCDGMSYKEISLNCPEIYRLRGKNKFKYRYPGGESYEDVIRRVKKIIIEIEKQDKDVLVIAHKAVNRCLFSYFIPTNQENIPYIDFPLNKIFKVFPEKGLYRYNVLDI